VNWNRLNKNSSLSCFFVLNWKFSYQEEKNEAFSKINKVQSIDSVWILKPESDKKIKSTWQDWCGRFNFFDQSQSWMCHLYHYIHFFLWKKIPQTFLQIPSSLSFPWVCVKVSFLTWFYFTFHFSAKMFRRRENFSFSTYSTVFSACCSRF